MIIGLGFNDHPTRIVHEENDADQIASNRERIAFEIMRWDWMIQRGRAAMDGQIG